MDTDRIRAILEALLFVSDKPVSLEVLDEVLGKGGVGKEDLARIVQGLIEEYRGLGRAFTIEEVGGGFQFRTRSEYASWIKRLAKARPLRLSKPALEVLSIVAYKQPVTHHEIELIRGVDSGGVLELLLVKKLIAISGRKQAPGRPILYKTSPLFLEVFNLKDLKDLPTLREYKDISDLGDLEPAARSLLEKMKDATPAGVQTELPISGPSPPAPPPGPDHSAPSADPGQETPAAASEPGSDPKKE